MERIKQSILSQMGMGQVSLVARVFVSLRVAVLEADGSLCYNTEITDDVIAGLDVEGVYKILDKISHL
jgi:hypothetical protein